MSHTQGNWRALPCRRNPDPASGEAVQRSEVDLEKETWKLGSAALLEVTREADDATRKAEEL